MTAIGHGSPASDEGDGRWTVRLRFYLFPSVLAVSGVSEMLSPCKCSFNCWELFLVTQKSLVTDTVYKSRRNLC